MHKNKKTFHWEDSTDTEAIDIAFGRRNGKARQNWINNFVGGKDHASPRYLTTKLNSITRCLFRNVDDELLEYVNEDGSLLNQNVIPMVLVNGSRGTGVGWSSRVPKYNPTEIIKNIRRKFKDLPVEEMTPWYKGFNGTVEKYEAEDKRGYFTYGLVDYNKKEGTCHIKELPVGKCIEGYHKFLKSRSIGTEKNDYNPLIQKFEKTGDAKKVGFRVTFNPDHAPHDIKDVIEKLDLKTKISIDNMHLYNTRGQIEKFHSAEKILEDFYTIRLHWYDSRKAKMLSNLESCCEELTNTIAFVRLVKKLNFDFLTKNSKDLQTYFKNLSVDAVRPEEQVGCDYGIYQSLLSLPLSTFFDESLEKLEAKQSETKAEMDALSKKTNIDLWEDDLKAFQTEWDKEEESSKSNVMAQQENQVEEEDILQREVALEEITLQGPL
ncbi:hypothetical protein TSUD_357460 [Trifolium subterraneum]|uniref:DNA topoisomerase (ATP-hydrolyzing) n=1 Tax=Trifolium subterraneum TaxID=3900 RepID=A0A2Z6MYF9_TRISU|nr:hypothetical protein TSUD_357460 [Trifolium subterraneum]